MFCCIFSHLQKPSDERQPHASAMPSQAVERLQAENAKLKEENGALIRVISKLSK